MPRAHLYRPVQDEMGNVLSDVVVRVFDTEGGELVPAVYLGPLDNDPTPQPLTFVDGVIDLYLPQPMRVRLGVQQGAAAEVFYEDIDVTLAGNPIAADVAFTPVGTLTSEDVQGALTELDDDIQTHLDAVAEAHAASAISFTPAEGLVATDVQAALEELGAAGTGISNTIGQPLCELFVQFNYALNDPLVSGDSYTPDWTTENFVSYTRGNTTDLSFDRPGGFYVVNTPGYYSFSLTVRTLDWTPGAPGVEQGLRIELGSDAYVPQAHNNGRPMLDEAGCDLTTTLATGFYNVGDTVYINDLVASFGSGAPKMFNIFMSGSRIPERADAASLTEEDLDPETGDGTTEYARFTLQTVVAGDLAVSPNIVKPGLRVPVPGQAMVIVARLDTVPTGADAIIVVKRINGGVYAGDIGTVTIPAGTSVGVTTGLTVDCAKGDILQFEVTQVGSTVAGADLNISVDFR